MKKIIISTVAVIIVLCIGIATLVMALIPVGLNDKVQLPDEIYIYCSQTNSSSFAKKRLEYRNRDGKSDIEKINKIYNIFNNSFQQKALTAMFNGEFNQSTEVEFSKVSKTISKNYSSSDVFTIVFFYQDAETATYNDQTYNYNYLFFELKDDNSRNEFVMGLNTSIPDDEEEHPIATISYKYSYKSKANFAELYKYISELVILK